MVFTGVLVGLYKFAIHEEAQSLGRVTFALKFIRLRIH